VGKQEKMIGRWKEKEREKRTLPGRENKKDDGILSRGRIVMFVPGENQDKKIR
jgi:hypothetical protein